MIITCPNVWAGTIPARMREFYQRTRPFLFSVRFFLATFAGLVNQYVCPPVRAGGGLLTEPVQSEFSATETYSEHPNSYYIINDCSLCNTDTAGPVSNKDGGDEQSEMAAV